MTGQHVSTIHNFSVEHIFNAAVIRAVDHSPFISVLKNKLTLWPEFRSFKKKKFWSLNDLSKGKIIQKNYLILQF
jgi:hypothetical protein